VESFNLNFEDTETAFSNISEKELKRKQRLFRHMTPGKVKFLARKSVQIFIALFLRIPVINFLPRKLIKSTFFKQFVGGESLNECEPTINELAKLRIGTILDYGVEAKKEEQDFENTKEEILRTIEKAKDDKRLPFSVFKVTGIGLKKLIEKVSLKQNLSESEKSAWLKVKNRVDAICSFAHSLGQPVLIDAEESWIQEAIDLLAEEMMEKYNREKPLIFNTIQLYRHDRFEFLRKSHEKAKQNKYILAVKLVRGAYMEIERERAVKENYPSPILPNKDATNKNYNTALKYCLENIKDIALVAGTHNEESIQLIAQILDKNHIPPNHPHIFLSQLYGMGDILSCILAKNNYNVSKYVPYGLVKELIPYLTRRAYENSSTFGHMSRELELINKELRRRKQK
jgi:proline dehydrogenase